MPLPNNNEMPYSPSRREALRRTMRTALGVSAALPLVDARALAGPTPQSASAGTASTPTAAALASAQTTGLLPDGIVLEDSGSGIARDRYHYVLGIPWRGSYIGASLGTGQLPKPGVIRIAIGGYQEAVVVRTLGYWANFAARESTTPPVLEVTYADGTKATLPCVADSVIAPTSVLPAGTATVISLGTAVLRFARPAQAVSSATIVLNVVGSSSGGKVSLECCAFVSPILPEPPVAYGLRARGLSGPTLINTVDFDQPGWSKPWFNQLSVPPSDTMLSHFVVDHDEDTGQPLGHKAFREMVGPTGSVPADIPPLPAAPTYIFPLNLGRELDEVYFQYRLRFGAGWRGGSRQSGKLPGIASDTTVAGNGGSTSDGHNGWSFRGLFVGEPLAPDSPYNSNNGVVPIGWYTYNPDQMAQNQFYGLVLPWTGRGSLGVLEVGKDYWIDQYVKVNTPGKNDGIVRAWINGKLAYERTDHIMRAEPPYYVPGNLAINKVWMTFLHGGDINPLPTKLLRVYWSDWTIATEYIGPPTDGGGGTSGPTTTNVAPAITITSPANGASFAAGATVTVTANASDSDGSVSKVEFYRDGVLAATTTAAPYAATFTGLTSGTHSLTAVATDNQGARTTSAAISITVASAGNKAPTVSITSPASGATFAQGATVTVTATAADTDGTISKVMLYVDGTAFATMAGVSPPYSAPLTNLAAGSHVLTAVATDNTGATTTSAAVTIQVGAVTTGGSTVTLQQGQSGYAGTKSTYLSAWYKNQNDANRGFLLESAAYVDLVRFSIFQSEGGPVPNGATITSATLSLYKTTSYDFKYEARRLLTAWVEGEATWNRPRAGATWNKAGAAGAGTDYASTADGSGSVGFNPDWLTIDVTAGVRAMASGQANNGWRLIRRSGNSNEKRFASSTYSDATLRPKLVITYK